MYVSAGPRQPWAKKRPPAMLMASVAVCVLAISALPAMEQVRYPADLPEVWDPGRRTPVIDAVQVWRLGSRYFEGRPYARLRPRRWPQPPFEGLTDQTRLFLRYPRTKPAVQFSCAVTPTPYEHALEKALQDETSPELRLQALVILMKVCTPSSVDKQLAALRALERVEKGPLCKALLSDLAKQFSPKVLAGHLAAEPLRDISRGRVNLTTWHIRAAGVTRCELLLPRLRVLSVSEHLHISLAAERSLEDFKGKKAQEALAYCVRGWRYDAAQRAARALRQRNRGLLVSTLLDMGVPGERAYLYGILLAECDEPRAVPILCEALPDVQIIDGKMLKHIARLARPEHLPLVRALPEKVHPDQHAKAERCLREVLARLQPRQNE